MFLEFATFIVLVLVLGVKYGTSTHISKLEQEVAELESTCRRSEHRYSALCERKTSIADEHRALDKDKLEAERELSEVRAALEDQSSRNQDLEDRIDYMVN